MKLLRNILYYTAFLFALLLIIACLLSFLNNTEYRYLKMLDFPRIQFFIGGIISLLLFIIITKVWRLHDYFLVGGLIIAIIFQGNYLINYTPLVNKAVPDAPSKVDDQDRFSVILINVKRDNRTAAPLLQLVKERKPDLLLAMEVNEWWEEKLYPIKKDYPYTQEAINNLGYGMTLYSKYPLKDKTTNNWSHDEVPSFSSTIMLKNGQDVIVHAVHPPPPLLYKEVPDNANDKEKAMLKVGDQVIDSNLPNIVMGDFNDVAWSHTNRMTKSKGELLDIRVGRGFYNSFDADSWWMRWPLDHVFVTKEFSVIKMERLPDVESDHFPIFVDLVLEKRKK